MLPLRVPEFIFQQTRDAEERADRVYEAIIGLVTDNKDPLKLGRVKVRFPTLPGSDQDCSWWAPIASLGAGKDRGWWFLPEVDDEVLVLFECGDIRKPVVLGALWNGVDLPPESNSGSNPKRLIVSREGTKITFDDDEGTVTVEDGGGCGKIVLSKDNKITIEALQGDLSVYCPKDQLAIVANEIEINGQQAAKLDAGGEVKIGTDGGATVKGGTMVQVQGSKVQLNPGGVQAPQAVSLQAAEIADPITSRLTQVLPGQAASEPAAAPEPAGPGGSDSSESEQEEGASEEASSGEAPRESGPVPEPMPLPPVPPLPPLADEDDPDKKHFIEIALIDGDGEPCAGEKYVITLPDGSMRRGALDAQGKARIDGLEKPGDCKVSFPDRDTRELESREDEGPLATPAAGSTQDFDMQLLDDAGKPVAYEPYVLLLPDGTRLEGLLDEEGRLHVPQVPAGECKLTFPERGQDDLDPA